MIYLFCGFQPLIVKKYMLEQYFKICHSIDYLNYSISKKLNVTEGLKLVYQKSSISSFLSSFQKSLQASYAFLFIAQNFKPFTESVFVKNCIIEAVKAFDNSLTLEEAINIPLSAKTVTSRIVDISDFIRDKL